jgi:hypothetical protein
MLEHNAVRISIFRFFRKDILLLAVFSCLALLYVRFPAYAQNPQTSDVQKDKPIAFGGGSSNGTVLPDLFTGSMGYSVPIEVPPGRHGMDPGLALTYNSRNGNGWVGVGWELEVGAIERNTRFGVDYNGDEFVLRLAGSAVDLVRISGVAPNDGEFRAKI